MNTSEFLTITSLIVPDRTATIFEGGRRSYQELLSRATRLANAMESLGVSAGDRIATMHVNCPQHIEIYFATALLDAIYVPINFRVRTDELTYMLNDATPKILFVGGRYTKLVQSAISQTKSVEHIVALEGEDTPWPFYEEFLSSGSEEEHFPQADDNDTTIIMFTAGTTGAPKGVMLTHNSFASYILANVSPADPEMEERNILTVPLYHIAGIQAVMAAVYGGRSLIIQRQFEAEEWMTLVQQEQANRAMMVPTMLKQL